MARINRNYEKLPGSYLFSEIARRTAAYQEANPDARLIKMGIGDVTRPLAPAVVAAMHAAVDDLAAAETFHGYGPAGLRLTIIGPRHRGITIDRRDLRPAAPKARGVSATHLRRDAVAVCDGLSRLRGHEAASPAVPGPDADAERWTHRHAPLPRERSPSPPDVVDLIYLCSPTTLGHGALRGLQK
ncbi:MAG: hypothetical protein ACLUE1_03685 [Adlercreutzia equolifaciens]